MSTRIIEDLGVCFQNFLVATEEMTLRSVDELELLRAVIKAMPAGSHVRESVRIAEPLVMEFLDKLIEKKRMLEC